MFLPADVFLPSSHPPSPLPVSAPGAAACTSFLNIDYVITLRRGGWKQRWHFSPPPEAMVRSGKGAGSVRKSEKCLCLPSSAEAFPLCLQTVDFHHPFLSPSPGLIPSRMISLILSHYWDGQWGGGGLGLLACCPSPLHPACECMVAVIISPGRRLSPQIPKHPWFLLMLTSLQGPPSGSSRSALQSPSWLPPSSPGGCTLTCLNYRALLLLLPPFWSQFCQLSHIRCLSYAWI